MWGSLRPDVTGAVIFTFLLLLCKMRYDQKGKVRSSEDRHPHKGDAHFFNGVFRCWFSMHNVSFNIVRHSLNVCANHWAAFPLGNQHQRRQSTREDVQTPHVHVRGRSSEIRWQRRQRHKRLSAERRTHALSAFLYQQFSLIIASNTNCQHLLSAIFVASVYTFHCLHCMSLSALFRVRKRGQCSTLTTLTSGREKIRFVADNGE